MPPNHADYDDLDDFDDFAIERSKGLWKMIDDYRREQRTYGERSHLERFAGRRHHVNWDWEDDDDWD